MLRPQGSSQFIAVYKMWKSIGLNVIQIVFVAVIAGSAVADFNDCGIRGHKKISGRSNYMFEGATAREREFPWHVSVQFLGWDPMFFRWGYQHKCGGTIISSGLVLTAAHCFDPIEMEPNPHNWYIQAGTDKISGSYIPQRDPAKERARHRSVECIIRHPLYNGGHKHDLAMVRTYGNLLSDSLSMPLCLRPYARRGSSTFRAKICVIAGWGLHDHSGRLSENLKFGEYSLRDWKSCKDAHTEYNKFERADQITVTNICAGGYGESPGACAGDGGGALACEYNGTYYFIGIVSRTEGCGLWKKLLPSVAVAVSSYTTWIYDMAYKYG